MPWLWSQAHVAIPGDMAWLSMAAEKFLDGQKMTEAFHDNNPPLCYLIYIPVAFLTAIGLPLWTAGFIYALSILLVFSGLLAVILRHGLGLGWSASCAVIAGYLLPLTVIMQPEFGNKDHLIAAALLPFLMAQLCLDRSGDLRRVIWITLVLGVPFLLMKPHYGLMPASLIAYRFFSGRGFRVMQDPDFIVLIAGVILYAAVIMIWFSDFISDILFSVSIGIYAGVVGEHICSTAAGMLLMSLSLIILAFCSERGCAERPIFIRLSFLSLISIIPFIAQMKGFSLHMIPTLALMFPAIMLSLVTYHGKNNLRKFLLVGAVVMIGYAMMLAYPAATHADIRNASLTRYVASHAESGFLMQDQTTNIVARIAAYTGKTHASRFSNMWFVPVLTGGKNKKLVESYAEMMAEDILRYKPDFIALYYNSNPGDDPLVLFAENDAFRRSMEKYTSDKGAASIEPIRPEQFYKRKSILIAPYDSYVIYRRHKD